MILCSKRNFVVPVRKCLSVILSQKSQLFTPVSLPLTRSCSLYKPNLHHSLLENWSSNHNVIYSASYHIKHSNDSICNQNRKLYYQNYFIRHSSNEADEKKEPEKKLGLFQKFKKMYKEYWYVLVPVHLINSVIWFGSFYYLAKSGVDIASLLEMVGASESFVEKMRNDNGDTGFFGFDPVGFFEKHEANEKIVEIVRNMIESGNMGYFAVASALYKIATPFRYTVTLGGTTLAINYLKDWGYIKPIPPREKIKEMIDEKKDNMKEFYEKVKKKAN